MRALTGIAWLAPVPALVTGVVLMRQHGVGSVTWAQQLIAGLTLSIVSIAFALVPRKISGPKPRVTLGVGVGALLLLAATLLQPDVDGVRRWIALGPLQLHAAFIAIPILIIALGIASDHAASRPNWLLVVAVGIAGGVLVLQPDASQSIAFAAAVAVLLFKRKPGPADWIARAIVVGGALLAFSRPDPLKAVPHVEGIVGLAASTGAGWLIAAVLALLFLPLPFAAAFAQRRGNHRVSLALAAYFALVIIASFVAPFPVPILGYGLSPVLGYFASLGWLVRSSTRASRKLRLRISRGN